VVYLDLFWVKFEDYKFLEVGLLNATKGSGGSAVSSPSKVWGAAAAEIEFVTFYC